MQHAVTRQAALGSFGPMTDSPEGRINRVSDLDAPPVLRWKITEGHQLFSVFFQTDGRLLVLRFIGLKE